MPPPGFPIGRERTDGRCAAPVLGWRASLWRIGHGGTALGQARASRAWTSRSRADAHLALDDGPFGIA
jgi:hypothetical protein